jgi:glyoxylase-like metal-dependent hydrolase (beta-lactamase superfamily II)
MGHTFGWPEILPRPVYATLKKTQALDPWFEIYELSEGIYALCEPFHFEEAISFLILGDEMAVLLDTGMGVADIRAEAESLTSLPLVAVNTHWHYDHIGGNYQFEAIWAFDNDFEVGKIERGLTRWEIQFKMSPELVCTSFPDGFDPALYQVRRSTVTRRLRHGEQIDLGNRRLTVYHTPGHSPGSQCLYDETSKTLFTGDLYYPGTLYGNLERSNLGDYLRSLQAMTHLTCAASRLATSHNEAIVPVQELRDARDGFLQIHDGSAPYTLRGETRLYRFDRFLVEYPHAQEAS